MKTEVYILPLLLMSTVCYSQDKIFKKNGDQFEAKITEVGTVNIAYKELDNLAGPVRSLEKLEIYKIIYENGKSEILGKYATAEEAKALIINKINEFGIDRDDENFKINAEFEGDQIKINSINKKGKVLNEGEVWDLGRVVDFHHISKRKNNIFFLNIITYKTRNSKTELDKLVIKMTDYEAAEAVLEAMKDLKIMLKKNQS